MCSREPIAGAHGGVHSDALGRIATPGPSRRSTHYVSDDVAARRRVAIKLKRTWHNGTRELVFDRWNSWNVRAAMTLRPESNVRICHGCWRRAPGGGILWWRTAGRVALDPADVLVGRRRPAPLAEAKEQRTARPWS